jgi:hypothetical protein
MRSTIAALLFTMLLATIMPAAPILSPDGVPLSPSDPGLGANVLALPGSTWEVWFNDNRYNTAPGVNGDFDFNDLVVRMSFTSTITHLPFGDRLQDATIWYVGSSAGLYNQLLVGSEFGHATEYLNPGNPVIYIAMHNTTHNPYGFRIGQAVQLTMVSGDGYHYYSGPEQLPCALYGNAPCGTGPGTPSGVCRNPGCAIHAWVQRVDTVPEPGGLIAGLGLVTLGWWYRRRQHPVRVRG